MSILSETDGLNDESEIVEYFKDCGHEYFECGQGIYQDEAELVIQIKDSYYTVTLSAIVLGNKQDRGDRLYYVDEITDVVYSKASTQDYKEWVNTDIWEKINYHENKIEGLKSRLHMLEKI